MHPSQAAAAAASESTPARQLSPSPSQLPPVPGSPTYSFASTANRLSAYNLPLPPPPRPAHPVLSKNDLEASQIAYTDLLATAKAYRLALASLSTAASAFGSALEACARLKEARAEPIGPSPNAASLVSSFHAAALPCTADPLLSASGVHHLVANHNHILSETVYRSFEVPLLDELDKWRRTMDDEEEGYVKNVRDKSREIRRLEKEGLKLHRQRRRDVGGFRAHLVDLTTKLDGLTALHADHARTLLRESQDTSAKIVDSTCSLVRAEVDIFESLARKGWSGGGLDDLLERGHDLFANTSLPDDHGAVGGGASTESAKLFSILPPRSILADAGTDHAVRSLGHARSDSLLMDDGDRYQSLMGAAVAPTGNVDDAETVSVFSNSGFNRPRGARPFSPQPIRRDPTGVPFDESLGMLRLPEDPEEEEGEGSQAGVQANGGHHGGETDVAETASERAGRKVVERLEAAVEERSEDEDDEEAHPWRDEGLRDPTNPETSDSTTPSGDTSSRSPGDTKNAGDGDGDRDGDDNDRDCGR